MTCRESVDAASRTMKSTDVADWRVATSSPRGVSAHRQQGKCLRSTPNSGSLVHNRDRSLLHLRCRRPLRATAFDINHIVNGEQ